MFVYFFTLYLWALKQINCLLYFSCFSSNVSFLIVIFSNFNSYSIFNLWLNDQIPAMQCQAPSPLYCSAAVASCNNLDFNFQIFAFYFLYLFNNASHYLPLPAAEQLLHAMSRFLLLSLAARVSLSHQTACCSCLQDDSVFVFHSIFVCLGPAVFKKLKRWDNDRLPLLVGKFQNSPQAATALLLLRLIQSGPPNIHQWAGIINQPRASNCGIQKFRCRRGLRLPSHLRGQ